MLIVPEDPASFNVTASSEDGILSYQWQKDMVNLSTEATSATYTIPSVVESDEGMYRCLVSSAAGTVISDAASLTVCKCVWQEYLHIIFIPSSLRDPPSFPPSLPPSLTPSLPPFFPHSLLSKWMLPVSRQWLPQQWVSARKLSSPAPSAVKWCLKSRGSGQTLSLGPPPVEAQAATPAGLP